MNEKAITLELRDGAWWATWHGDEAERIRGLFGTGTIPTPFTSKADPAEVKRAIAERNDKLTDPAQ